MSGQIAPHEVSGASRTGCHRFGQQPPGRGGFQSASCIGDRGGRGSGWNNLSVHSDQSRHRSCRCRSDAGSASGGGGRNTSSLLPLGDAIGLRLRASSPRGRRFERRRQAASDRCWVRSEPDRAFTLTAFSRSSCVARRCRRGCFRYRTQGFDVFTSTIKAGEMRLPVTRQVSHQGTTLPAVISSGRGDRPSMALRCGKRPKRAIISRCFFAYSICSSSEISVKSRIARF